MIKKNFKSKLKKIRLIFYLNAVLKSKILKIRSKYIKKIYEKKLKETQNYYDKNFSIKNFKKNHFEISPLFTPKKKGDLNIFWVGAHEAQDKSGFLQALRKFGCVECFKNSNSEYGPLYKAQGLKWLDVRKINDHTLLEQVKKSHKNKKINLLFGQMWSHVFSKEALLKIRELSIPVVNIAMDDKLPELWGYKDNQRLGSVGLGNGVDMTLTTTIQACQWYSIENMPSLFWPLASDFKLFGKSSNITRDIDILFIGNRYGIRGKIIDYLFQNGVNVTCYGNGWPNGPVNADQNVALSKKAKIILGVGTIGYCSDVYTLKLRDFDALMTGALYITHRNPDLLQLFCEGYHLECYENENELLEKIKYYLNQPYKRAIIGKQGKKKAKKYHTWETRIQQTFYELDFISKDTF